MEINKINSKMKIKINFKLLINLIIFIFIIFNNKNLILINENYLQILKNMNLTFNKKIRRQIRIGIYGYCIFNGGRARITALLINYLYKIKIFKIFLFIVESNKKNEYIIPNDIKRYKIKNNLMRMLKINKIDILIYQLDNFNEIELLNNINDIKVIFYHHSSNFDWIYSNYTNFKTIYRLFLKSKYFISIIPFENDYLFKKWGIRSILMNNFMTYEYNLVIHSDLSNNSILMIGRGQAKKKRFKIGIQSMEFIIEEIIGCQMKIISDITHIGKLIDLVNNLNLNKNIEFIGYNKNPEIYFRNSSLIIVPSISEAFPMVIIESKIFGIPNILLGLDYLTIAKGGTIIIYDDTPESISKESIKVLKNQKYKEELGKEARNSMKKYDNKKLVDKWIELIISIYNGDQYYQKLREKYENISNRDLINIGYNQIKLLKMRLSNFINITKNDYENFTIMENWKYLI